MDRIILYMFLGWVLSQTTTHIVATLLPSYRLDGKVVPHHYNLEIYTNLDGSDQNKTRDCNFWGAVRIEVLCKEDTNRIVIHSSNLSIDKEFVTLNERTGVKLAKGINIINHSFNPEHEFYIVETENQIEGGKNYSFFVPFDGVLREQQSGFAKAYYEDSNHVRRPLAFTQFEATYARRAFPCFDEPAMKATFKIHLAHHEKYTALSNMPIEETTLEVERPGWIRDHFATSVSMSTYLVAFFISDFTFDEITLSKSGVEFCIWAPKERIRETEFAERYSPKVLDFFEKYFEIKYPLPKVDMIPVPRAYYPTGAMENWGLITYGDNNLLIDANTSHLNRLQSVARIIAHELAHQWCGNLVTMEWWNQLWLNEGFATYFALIATDAIKPEWNFAEEYFADWLTTVWGTPEPVLVLSVQHPNEIQALFSIARYQKGIYVLRMMSHFLGKEVLRAGLIHYMKRHQYGSVMQDDLWTALTEVAHEYGVSEPKTSVKMIMDPWTSQTGYPVLDVKKNSDGLITVSQYIFEPEPSSADKVAKNESSFWPIPITYTTGEIADFSNTKPQKWLIGRGSLAIPDLKADDGQWIVFNLQVAALTGEPSIIYHSRLANENDVNLRSLYLLAMYRVNYYEENWELLKKALETEEGKKKIHPLNRKQIFEDALAFGWSRDLDYKFVFSLCACLRDEADYLPLSGAHSSLRRVDLILRRTPNYGYFKSYMRKLTNPIISRSGSLLDTPMEAQAIKKQNLMTDIASRYGIGNYVKQSLDLFSKWYNIETPDSVNPIPKNILRQISCTAIKNGGDEEWDFLWERYLNSDSASEKSSILSALTCSRKVWALKRYLDWSIDEFSSIPTQDSVHIFEAVAENEVGFEVAKDFFEKRIPDIFTYHGADNAIMGRYIQVLADQMTSIKEYNEIKALTEKFDEYFKVSKPVVERALDTIDANVKWHAVHYVKVPQYLAPSLRTL